MNASGLLLKSIFIFPHDEDIIQPIDYEHIPFVVKGTMNMNTFIGTSPSSIPPSQRR